MDRKPGKRCFHPSNPFDFSKKLAVEYDCDLSIPNGLQTGIGNVLMFTPLVEAMARKKGRPLRLLSAPLNPLVGVTPDETDYPVWLHNPYVESIVTIPAEQESTIAAINAEQDNCCQFNHVIENICFNYKVRPRHLRPEIFLSHEEQSWALEQLRHLQRPVIALHPSGTTAPTNKDGWGRSRWLEIISECHQASFVQIGKPQSREPELGIPKPRTTLRQAFALIWASDIFIGFDSSPMHVATAFQKPVLALWDALNKLRAEESWQAGFSPAVMLRWSYPQNRNLMILGEKDKELKQVMLAWINEQVKKIT